MVREVIEIDPISSDRAGDPVEETHSLVTVRPRRMAMVFIVAVLLVGLIGSYVIVRAGPDREPTAARDEELGSESSAAGRVDERLAGIPGPLLAGELFVAAPNRDRLRDVFESIGGFDGLRFSTAEGAFDTVGFDPLDPDRLLASRRLSYGPAENQLVNEMWWLDSSNEAEQMLWAPEVAHDFSHFNADGTITMWVHGGGTGFAPRIAIVLDGTSSETILTTEPMFASRFAATSHAVFALTGTGVYGTTQSGYVDLIADAGERPVVLADGELFGWIDTPTPNILVGYPAAAGGTTAVWDTATLQPITNHVLAGRRLVRLAVSGDRRTAVGATPEGSLQVIDLETGVVRSTFGHVDIAGVDQPIALDADGTVAITVERSGLVQIWWVGDDRPVASIEADAAQPRWISQEYAPQSTSIVAAGAERMALRRPALPGIPTRWDFVETSVDVWIERACQLAGRPLDDEEAAALGLLPDRRAC